MCLPERPSPDGGEFVSSAIASEEEEAWPEWDDKVGTVMCHYT